MKRINVLAVVPYTLVVSLPLILASCTTPEFMDIGGSRNSDNYYNQAPQTSTSTAHSVKNAAQASPKAKATTTKMVEPGISTVDMSKPTSTTTSVAPVDGPMVPGTAPSVGH